MAKIMGFNNSYNGLNENEAWQKIYEFGKNLMPIKENRLQKKYNKIFNKTTKVVRDGVLTKIGTDKLVPNDIILIEKGDFIPVDGKVLEENSLEFEKKYDVKVAEFSDDINNKVVYQGMKVKKGKAIIEALRTGDATYLGSFVKQIDNKSLFESKLEKILNKYISIIIGLGIVFLLFGFIFSLITSEANLIDKLIVSGYSGLLLFFATLPIGALIVFFLKLIDEKSILNKSNLIIKRNNTLLKAHKVKVICVDERFLSRNYEKYIQRFYGAGIKVLVISNKKEEEIKEIAKKAGIFENEVNTLMGKDIYNMKEEEFNKAICDTVIFYEVNREEKQKIIEGFNKLNIKTISIIDEMEDLITLKYTDVGVCTHDRKNTLEYEFSNANIIGTELTSIYSLIKGSCIMKNYLNHYIKYYIMFQLPVILSLLTALLSGLDLKFFYFQTLMFIMIINPLLLLLVNRDYSEEKIFELKNRDKTFLLSCIKFSFIGILIGILGIGFYSLLTYFNVGDFLKVGAVTILFTILSYIIVFISRRKFKTEETKNKEVSKINEVSTTNNKVEKKIKRKVIKLKDNKKGEDISNNIL